MIDGSGVQVSIIKEDDGQNVLNELELNNIFKLIKIMDMKVLKPHATSIAQVNKDALINKINDATRILTKLKKKDLRLYLETCK